MHSPTEGSDKPFHTFIHQSSVQEFTAASFIKREAGNDDAKYFGTKFDIRTFN